MFGIYCHKPSDNELLNDGGDCITAPATPGLLIFRSQAEIVRSQPEIIRSSSMTIPPFLGAMILWFP